MFFSKNLFYNENVNEGMTIKNITKFFRPLGTINIFLLNTDNILVTEKLDVIES